MGQTAPFSPLPPVLELLAHDLRWQLVQALAYSDRRVQELVELVARPPNLVSYHLRRLREGALVREHRSSADGRDVYYSLDLLALQAEYLASAASLHPALGRPQEADPEAVSPTPPVRVLFLCTHNSARSQIAEALLRHLSHGQVEVHSAGSEPGTLHPLTVQVMAEHGLNLAEHYAKSLDLYQTETFEYVVTVCDRARETCPLFQGEPQHIHWSFPDPAAVEGHAAQLEAFRRTVQELTTRIRLLLTFIQRTPRVLP